MSNQTIENFISLIAQLRDPNNGCPWDLKQNFHSMIPCLLEETYETIEAIQQNNFANLKEELGDLLLQVVFLCQLAQEQNKFSFKDVVREVSEKIIRRHPHVFGDKTAKNEEEALNHWNAIKSQEQKTTSDDSILDNIPQSFPALMRAEKLQKRCAKVGFDWVNIDDVFHKVEEEITEVKQAILEQQTEKIAEEMGDLLFATVNLSRHLNCQAEQTLRQANQKFEQRFRFVEQQVIQQGKRLENMTLEQLDCYWEQAKDYYAS